MEASNALRSPSIRDRFLADHRRIDDLLERLIDAFGANDSEEMGRLWTQLESGLLAHLEAEERHMLPAFAEVAPEESKALAQEHDRIRSRLSELGAALDLHLVRLDTARAFAAELRAHAREEDDLLYRWAETHLEPSRARSLLDAASQS